MLDSVTNLKKNEDELNLRNKKKQKWKLNIKKEETKLPKYRQKSKWCRGWKIKCLKMMKKFKLMIFTWEMKQKR